MPDKQRTFGQFETPPDVADILLSLCVRRASDRVLDPSCGSGLLLERVAHWQSWLADDERDDQRQLWGVELDKTAAGLARQRLPHASILQQNFFTLDPEEPFDALVGNPPYTRAEWFDQLQQQVAQQLPIFDREEERGQQTRSAIIPGPLWKKHISRRAGLHAYFILHGAHFLREGGRFGFVLPNNWLDVGYGETLKRFLLEHFKIIALVETTSERWFADARVNTCLLMMEKCSDSQERASQLVRFVQLRQPLAQLIPYSIEHRARFSAVEQLTIRMLPAQDQTSHALRVRVAPQRTLSPAEKWGMLWRAPAIYRQVKRHAARRALAPLRQWASVQRGYTTGANTFFYMNTETVEKWEIEPQFRKPLLKSLRNVACLAPEITGDCQVFLVSPIDNLSGTAAGSYVQWGESQGFDRRSTCRLREPWYALPPQEAAELVLAKGIWERHLAPLLQESQPIDQQLYRLAPQPGISLRVAAPLLNSSWLALQLELQGRVNFGEGVLWLAAYEVQNLLLPDPRRLGVAEVNSLEHCFDALSRRPISRDLETELASVDRRQLDDAVFGLMGITPTEATILLETLLERVSARQASAR